MTEQRNIQPVLWSPAALALAAALASILLRLPTVLRMPLTWDGVQYVLGVLHYDLAMHEPHPPGYFLYVQSGRLLHLAGMSPHAALLTVTLLCSAAMALVLVGWAGRMGGRHAAIAAAALCVFSPLVWSASTDPNTYAVAGAASALVGWLCWRTWREGGWWAVASGAALGLAAGFRPTTALFLLPLWVGCLLVPGRASSSATQSGQPFPKQSGVTWALAGLLAMVITNLAWALPQLAMVGGLAKFREVNARLGSGIMVLAPITGNLGRLEVHLATLLTGSVSALLLGWLFVPSAARSDLARARWFLGLWLGPALVFFVLVHLANPQYLMDIAPPLLLLGAIGLGRGLGDMSSRWRRVALLVVLVGVDAAFTWFSVVKPQRATERELQLLAQACLPYRTAQTVAITSIASAAHAPPRGRWLPYRVAMYLLPEVTVCIFPLERTGTPGTMPNAGRDLKSAALVPPVSFRGTRNLLLLGEGMVDYLPEGIEPEPVLQGEGVDVYVVPLDPNTPLVLGANGQILMTPRNGGQAR